MLQPNFQDPVDLNHLSDEILRRHFRQSVIANMRVNGEPVFESDFPPGSGQMKKLSKEPYGKERLEMGMDLRLQNIVRAQ